MIMLTFFAIACLLSAQHDASLTPLCSPVALETSGPRTGKKFVSPDHRLYAIVLPSGKGGKESRVEVFAARGARIGERDFGSADGEHGESVVKAARTPDSQFFVWSMENSGGHSPWNCPTYAFSRRRRAAFSLDRIVGGITSAEFVLQGPDVLRSTRLDPKSLQRMSFTVRLGKLLR